MAEIPLCCAKCGGTMVKGLAADKTYQNYFPMWWLDGDPVHARVLGVTGDNLDIGSNERWQMYGLRCERCGFLELYAR